MPSFGVSSVDPGVTAEPRNNAWMGVTAAGGTAFTAILPPLEGYFLRAGAIRYTPGATAHVLTFMIAQNLDIDLTASSEALSGQAVVNFSSIPTLLDGSLLAANDYVTIQHEDASVGVYIVSSISGKAVTMTTNLTATVSKGGTIWAHGVAGDACHTRRQLTTVASTVFSIAGGDERLCLVCAPKANHPILFYSPNGTNAGILDWLPWYYMPS